MAVKVTVEKRPKRAGATGGSDPFYTGSLPPLIVFCPRSVPLPCPAHLPVPSAAYLSVPAKLRVKSPVKGTGLVLFRAAFTKGLG